MKCVAKVTNKTNLSEKTMHKTVEYLSEKKFQRDFHILSEVTD